MIVIVMITLAGLSFVVSLSTENKAVHRQGDQLQLDEALASGVELLKAFCSQSAQLRGESGGTQDNAAVFGNIEMPVDGGARERSAVEHRCARHGRPGRRRRCGSVCRTSRRGSTWECWPNGSGARRAARPPPCCSCRACPRRPPPRSWTGSTPTASRVPGGAEAEYYAGLGLPYEPRNGVPALLEELLLVRDVSRQALFGADANFDFRVDAGESRTASPASAVGREDDLPWCRLLTVYSAERNTTLDGKPRINLNQPDLKKLHAQLTEALERPWADFVVAYRQFGPSDEVAAGRPAKEDPRGRGSPRSVAGNHGDSRNREDGTQLDLSVPAKYEIECVLDLVGAAVALPPKPDAAREGRTGPRPVACPLEDNPQAVSDQLPRLADLTTTTDQAFIYGSGECQRGARVACCSVCPASTRPWSIGSCRCGTPSRTTPISDAGMPCGC